MPLVVERFTEPASAFHARDPGPVTELTAWVAEPTARALVLGSTQDPAVARPGPGVAVVRRRSGGGAVVVAPGEQVWVDVLVPAGHPRWEPDVGRSFLWVGDAWVRALGGDVERHDGPLLRRPWSDLVCFAGLAPGEVVDGTGRKLVGIAQRRTRHAARFQCSVPTVPWRPGQVLDHLALDAGARAEAEAALAGRVGHVADGPGVLQRFLEELRAG